MFDIFEPDPDFHPEREPGWTFESDPDDAVDEGDEGYKRGRRAKGLDLIKGHEEFLFGRREPVES